MNEKLNGFQYIPLEKSRRGLVMTEGKRPQVLTPAENQLLYALMCSRNELVLRGELILLLYPDLGDSRQAFDVTVCRLRKKVGQDRILTVRNQGYIFRDSL